MDNQHQKITGYRDLSQEEIDAMNLIKAEGADLEALIERIGALPDVDQRWVAIAKTNLQQGIMALVRSVARPTSF